MMIWLPWTHGFSQCMKNIFLHWRNALCLRWDIHVKLYIMCHWTLVKTNTIFCCICRWCSHFLDNLKEKSPKLEIKKKFYFHLISTFTQSCQKSEFYWEAGTQQNPNLKSAWLCIVFISSRILHYSVCNIDFQSEWICLKMAIDILWGGGDEWVGFFINQSLHW